MSIPALINRVTAAGFAVVVKSGVPSLKRQRGDKALPPELIEELKQRRDEVLDWFGQPDPFHQSPLPTMPSGAANETSQWVTCKGCNAEVNPHQMKQLPLGMWVQWCGLMECPHKTG